MKYTAIVALTLATAQASYHEYFPTDPTDLAACDTNTDLLTDKEELYDCLCSVLDGKQISKCEKQLNRFWGDWDANGDGNFDEGEQKKVYYGFECSDSGSDSLDEEYDNSQQKCSVAWVHHWFGEDLTTCAAGIDGDGCVTVPVGMEFTADNHLAAAF